VIRNLLVLDLRNCLDLWFETRPKAIDTVYWLPPDQFGSVCPSTRVRSKTWAPEILLQLILCEDRRLSTFAYLCRKQQLCDDFRDPAHTMLSIFTKVKTLAAMACFIWPSDGSIENGDVQTRYVVDVDIGPQIQPFPDDSALFSVNAGFDETRDFV